MPTKRENSSPATLGIIGEPLPVAFALFGFALAIFGVRFYDVSASTLASGPVTVGLNYALLVAGIGESIAGIISIVRGSVYSGYIVTAFGLWLIGFFLMATTGVKAAAFTTDAFAWYALMLLVPVVILAVPAFVKHEIVLSFAFVALAALLLLFGLGYHDVYTTATSAAPVKDFSTAVDLLKVSAWCSFAGAVAIWWLFAQAVYRITGVLHQGETAETELVPDTMQPSSTTATQPPSTTASTKKAA